MATLTLVQKSPLLFPPAVLHTGPPERHTRSCTPAPLSFVPAQGTFYRTTHSGRKVVVTVVDPYGDAKTTDAKALMSAVLCNLGPGSVPSSGPAPQTQGTSYTQRNLVQLSCTGHHDRSASSPSSDQAVSRILYSLWSHPFCVGILPHLAQGAAYRYPLSIVMCLAERAERHREDH